MKVKLQKNGWHSKIQSFVLGKNKPQFDSLCPYFWTTVFCILVTPFISFYKLIKLFGKSLHWLFSKGLDGLVYILEHWITSPLEKMIISNMSDKQLINYAVNFEPELQRKYTRQRYISYDHYFNIFNNTVKKKEIDYITKNKNKYQFFKKIQQEKAKALGIEWNEKEFLEKLDQKIEHVHKHTIQTQEQIRQWAKEKAEKEYIQKEKLRKEAEEKERVLAQKRREEEERERQKQVLAEKYKEELRIQAQIKIAKRRKLFAKIIKYTKIITPIIFTFIGIGVIYFIYKLLMIVGPPVLDFFGKIFKTIYNFLSLIISDYILNPNMWLSIGKWTLIIGGILIALLLIINVVKFFSERIGIIISKIHLKNYGFLEKFERIFQKISFDYKEKRINRVFKPFKVHPIKKIKFGIHNFTEFFKMYFKAAKKNYCPEIEWVDETINK